MMPPPPLPIGAKTAAALRYVCAVCYARHGEPCVTTTGNRAQRPHRDRLEMAAVAARDYRLLPLAQYRGPTSHLTVVR